MRRPGIFAPPGQPGDVNLMLSWRPGAVTCYYDYLRANRLVEYKAQYPAANIIVRFPHPQNWQQNIEGTAVAYARQIAAKWPELRALNPYVCFANELNIHYENGDADAKNQPRYESQSFYEQIGRWVTRTAQVIKNLAPEMKLVTPPFAPGRHEDGSPDDQGKIMAPFAGYDYLAEAVRTYFDNTLAIHAYWGDINGSHQDWLRDPQAASWRAFRWRRVLNLFQTRYQIQARLIIDEAGNYATYDPDFFDQLTYFSNQTLADPRVLALTFFIWEDPTFSPGNIFNVWSQYILDLPAFTRRLAALPDIAANPTAVLQNVAGRQTETTTIDGNFDGPVMRVLFDENRVESMPLETYLRGVVPAEMPASWHPEAVKAQAIAARTYALNTIQRGRFRDQGADISASFERSQQYDPSRIHKASDAAILATKGLVLTYNGNLIDAVFSANCGGQTRNNDETSGFGKTPLPYLRSVSCPNPGPKDGHGVGMCQYGARDLAEQGQTYEQILQHYYRNVSIVRMATDSSPVQPSQPTTPSTPTTTPTPTTPTPTTPAATRLWTVSIQRIAGFSVIVGNLFDRRDIDLKAVLPNGQQVTTRSGTKAEYGPGGFEVLAPLPGNYSLEFLNQRFILQMDGQTTARLSFVTGDANLVRVHGAIAGVLTDEAGRRLAGHMLRLDASAGSQTVLTDRNGLYRFENLRAGSYRLTLAGESLVQTLNLDGQSFQPVDLKFPNLTESQGWKMVVTFGSNVPVIVGDIGQPGQPITLTSPNGTRQTATSGTKPEYGPGGFEFQRRESGFYTLQFGQQRYTLLVQGNLARLRFERVDAPPVRLTSEPLARAQAEAVLARLATDPSLKSIFSIKEL